MLYQLSVNYVLWIALPFFAARYGFSWLRRSGTPIYAACALAPVIAALVFYGYSQVYWEGWHYRMRMTVNVKTPEGLKTGSSVIDVGVWRRRLQMASGPHAAGATTILRGVAPIVDMGRYGTLIALLAKLNQGRWHSGGHSTSDVPRIGKTSSVLGAVLDPEKGYASTDAPLWGYSFKKTKLTRVIPELVWIPAGGTHKDAEVVWPDEFQWKIGDGVTLKSITVEPTWDRLVGIVENPPEWMRVWTEKIFAEEYERRRNPKKRRQYLTLEESKKFRLWLSHIQTGRL